MTERPIIFSAPMVQAILAGHKTMTRRILKAEIPTEPAMDNIAPRHTARHAAPYLDAYCGAEKTPENPRGMTANWAWWTRDDRPGALFKVGFIPGDFLWVREAIWQASPYPGTLPSGEPDESCRWSSRLCFYAADGEPPDTPNRHYPSGGRFSAPDPWANWLKRPSIHMPRWASRITLKVTSVKVERLQDISKADVIREGITERDGAPIADVHAGWHEPYATLWDSINGAGAWAANPYVVAISFERVKP